MNLSVRSLMPRLRRSTRPGAAPGIEVAALAAMPATGGRSYLSCIDYGTDEVIYCEIVDVDQFLRTHRPAWSRVRWINLDGLGDLKLVKALAEKYELHPLAIEDVLHVPQRPKFEVYPATQGHPPRAFCITRMLQMPDNHLHSEQTSIFLGRNTVITFQETRGDVWDPIRQRINTPGSRLRQNGADFLVYALLDATVDYCFPILEKYGDRLEEIEARILEDTSAGTMQEVHLLRRELLMLRREVWPQRDMVTAMRHELTDCIEDNTRVYLRDVSDHAVQILELVETYREMADHLIELHLSAVNMKMNAVMKLLTMITSVFIPMSFLAGVFGMNFNHLPGLSNPWAFSAFCAVCLFMGGGMLIWFRRNDWL